MNGAEKGLLMLTSNLGDESVTPLPYRQFHALRKRVNGLVCEQDKELAEMDLRRLGLSYELSAQIIKLLSREELLDAYLSAGEKQGIYSLTRLNSLYPRHLEEKLQGNAPPVLFYKGNKNLLKMPCVSVVGSRKILENNRRFAWQIGELAAEEGYSIVSGGAVGADSAAQDACLKNGGSVIVFTPEELNRQKDNDNVLYLSENGWNLAFSAQRALNRNRLIHAMGDKTFVAQCSFRKGGSWRGAEENLKHGYSTVFVYWDGSKGAAALLQLGAVDITEPNSIRNLKTGQQSMFAE